MSGERWFHPLISSPPRRVGRRRLLAFAGGGMAAAVAAPGLRLVTAQSSPASPEAAVEATGDDDAVALLTESAAAMAELETFTFELENVQGEAELLEGFSLEAIEGAVRRPLDFTAVVSIGVPFGTIDVTATGIDGKAWIQNPIEDGAWIELSEIGDITALVNPDALILSAVNVIQDARIQDTESVGGVNATRIAGTIDFAAAAERYGGQDVQLPEQISQTPIPVLVWIDEEKRIIEIEIQGPILTSDSDDIIRSVTFDSFNEPVEIEAPDI